MSAVRFVFPKLRLSQLLKEPGGTTVAEAVAQAQENLQSIKPTCVAELGALQEQAERALANWAPGGEAELLLEIYTYAVRAIGAGEVCGVPAVDPALTSLCDLLDHMRSNQRFDREAIQVHVQSWRLLMNPALPAGGAGAVLDGLRRVTQRYAAD
jgi:hypothetical protein